VQSVIAIPIYSITAVSLEDRSTGRPDTGTGASHGCLLGEATCARSADFFNKSIGRQSYSCPSLPAVQSLSDIAPVAVRERGLRRPGCPVCLYRPTGWVGCRLHCISKYAVPVSFISVGKIWYLTKERIEADSMAVAPWLFL